MESVFRNDSPTMAEIVYHNNIANDLFENTITKTIYNFITDDIDETMNIDENIFEDNWIFALVMGACGKFCKNTNVAILYNRSDGVKPASIGIVNKVKKHNRLVGELAQLEEKIKNMQEGSSKYEKVVDKIEKIKLEIEKYKPICA